MARIRAALAPCQSCDANTHHGRSHVQATDFTLSHRVDDGRGAGREAESDEPTAAADSPHRTVTHLDRDDEDRLRRAMASLFGLDPMDLLLVQHIMRGGRLSTFNRATALLSRRLASYHGTPRAQAHAAKVRIGRAFPAIAPVLQHLVNEGGDKDGGALASALDAENEIIETCGASAGSVKGDAKRIRKGRKGRAVTQGELFG